MKSLLPIYPRRGHLDVVHLGQEDEATPDPDGVVWDVGEVAAQGMETAIDSDDDEDVQHVLDFDAGD